MSNTRARRTPDGGYMSPAVIVRADTSILDCVRRMQKEEVGSAAIVSDDESMDLVGIFTERDLLKNLDALVSGVFWDKPVRTVMSSPVVTVNVDQLHRAGDLMLAKGFRHLPVVDSSDGKQRLAGVVSIRDLYRAEIDHRKRVRKRLFSTLFREGKLKGSLQIIENDSHLQRLMEGAFGAEAQAAGRVRWEAHRPQVVLGNAPWVRVAKKAAAILLDLDGVPEAVWKPLLKEISALAGAQVFLIYTPDRHSEETRANFEELASRKPFLAYPRPLNLSALFLNLVPLLLPQRT